MFDSKKESPERKQLRRVQAEIAQVQAKLKKAVQRGLKTDHSAILEGTTVRARGLVLELSALTWQAQELQMQLAQELPTCTPAAYYYAPQLEQWAKVHALPTGRFLFEALTHDGQGVLAELGTFEFLAPWQASTAGQYRAQLQLLLDTTQISWNKAGASLQ